MMSFITAILLIVGALPAASSTINVTGQIQVEGVDAKRVSDAPRDLSINIVLANGEKYKCRNETGNSKALSCFAHLKGQPQPIRVEISAAGYKKYSVNVPFVEFRSQAAKVDIGRVILAKSELPTVEQIVLTHNLPASLLFVVTLHNSLRNEILINTVAIYASVKWNSGASCGEPLPKTFIVNDKLSIVGGGGRKKTVVGSFEDIMPGRKYLVDASGIIEIDPCRWYKKIELHMPTAFVLPKEEYTSVEIALPRSFKVSPHPDPIIELDDQSSFSFSFETQKGDELPIRGEYKSH